MFYDSVASNKVVATIVGIVIVLVTLYVIMMALRSEEVAKPIITGTSLGDVQISMTAVEAIAQRAAQKVHGIRNVEAAAEGDEEGLTLYARIHVYPDVSIPEVARTWRKSFRGNACRNRVASQSVHRVEEYHMESKPRP